MLCQVPFFQKTQLFIIETHFESVDILGARNGGMLIGPGFFALIAFAVKRGEPVAPAA